MKSLANPGCKSEVLERLRRVTPDSRRRWGRMTAHQMVCHLADAFRAAMGLKAVSPAGGFLTRTLVKWVAIYAPMPWIRNYMTRPEMNQQVGGTRPVEFERDVTELQLLVEKFARGDRDFRWEEHPVFGPMSDAQWLRWGYLHLDHHLRQFGL